MRGILYHGAASSAHALVVREMQPLTLGGPMSDHGDYYAHSPEHYANDRRQAAMFLTLLAVAAILSVVMILWAVMV
jgi:hypothetical protein